MASSDLKYLYECADDGCFFTRSTMSFFGDTMRNYGVRLVMVVDKYPNEGEPNEPRKALELYRRRAVKHGLQSSAYFSTDGKQLSGAGPFTIETV